MGANHRIHEKPVRSRHIEWGSVNHCVPVGKAPVAAAIYQRRDGQILEYGSAINGMWQRAFEHRANDPNAIWELVRIIGSFWRQLRSPLELPTP